MPAPAPATNASQVDRRLLSALENLLAEIHKAVRAVSFYPQGHPMLVRMHQSAFALVAKAARHFGELELEIGRRHVSYKGSPIGPQSEAVQSLCQQLFKRRMKKFILMDGVTIGEFTRFLAAAALDAEEVYLRGGIDTILIEGGVRHIWANQVDFERLRRKEEGEEEEKEEPEEPEAAAAEEEPQAEEDDLLDTLSVEEAAEAAETPEEQSLRKILSILDRTEDPEKYYEGALLLASLAEHFVQQHLWKPLLKLIVVLEHHSADPARSVEFKKYSFRALRKITTPEVIRGLLTELVAEGRSDDEIASLLGILAILGGLAADAVLHRLPFAKDPYAQNLLEQALYRIGPVAAPKLHALLASGDPAAVKLALRALAAYRLPESVEQLRDLAIHPDAAVREERVRTLLRIRTAAALDQIYDLLLQNDDDLRGRIVRAFGHSREVRAVPVLLNLARAQKEFSVGPELRPLLFEALGRIGGAEVAQALAGFAAEKRMWRPRYDDDSVREALGALGRCGTSELLGTLEALSFKSPEVEEARAQACARIAARAAQGGEDS